MITGHLSSDVFLAVGTLSCAASDSKTKIRSDKRKHLTHVVRDAHELSEALIQRINRKMLPDRDVVKRFIKMSYANTIFVERYDGEDFTNSGLTDHDGRTSLSSQ